MRRDLLPDWLDRYLGPVRLKQVYSPTPLRVPTPSRLLLYCRNRSSGGLRRTEGRKTAAREKTGMTPRRSERMVGDSEIVDRNSTRDAPSKSTGRITPPLAGLY